MTTLNSKKLHIDIVSDVVCPWCIVGYRQLEKALQASGTDYELHWQPFELNPDMVPEGQNLSEHLAEKYGASKEQSQENRLRITQAGAELGFEFSFADDMRMHNTFNVHQLLHWADQQGHMHDLKQAFFVAHFTHRRNLSDNNVLADVAAEIGLNRDDALAVVADQRFANEVRATEQSWISQGISGVPAVIFNRRHLVTGAQGVENYTRILEQLAAAGD
ncbi:DsbA family oxidoreductase [Pseudomonas anguilliseptica]|uniref:Predicted dithiol-disulfide isomerase, DsbA family n=1 Tax=Pseudomonas anguilliseptica TaxID=53406 RepID=A0A1H5G8S5_PSEAG|nr:DsbA family oxidoreductase [Pseudomonas anguilliseptica]SEE11901.1 Predicted dithiol-disulfide isomerase, DsbA family [Pseudomonas anguilliseptica]